MGQFTASLRLPGDSRALAAVINLHDGRIQVESGDHLIGDWELGSIDLTPIPEGIRLSAEGEVLLLDIPDRAGFEEETTRLKAKKRKLARLGAGSKSASKNGGSDVRREVHTRAVKPTPERSDSKLDRFLESAQGRLGSTLPDWVFTKGGLVMVVAALVLCVLFADLISTLLLIAGVIVLLTGGVTMLDSVIARRVLRHKITPVQVVIVGGTIFVAGLLVGVVA